MPFLPLTTHTGARSGFVPLQDDDGDLQTTGFVPLEDAGSDTPRPSVLKTVALENPATALAETGAHLATMGVAQPVAGIAGLATEAAHAVGLTDRRGADVVRSVSDAMTYQPRGEFGKAAADLATKPFQWLAEKGQEAGTATLEATGSPALATAVDTAVNAAPMAIAPAAKAGKAGISKIKGKVSTETAKPDAVATLDEPRGFTPLDSTTPATPRTIGDVLADVKGKTVKREVVIAETGQRVTLKEPAANAILEMRGNIEVLEALRDVVPDSTLKRGMATVGEKKSIPEFMATDLSAAAADYVKTGYGPKEAALEAIDDLLWDARRELRGAYSQLGIKHADDVLPGVTNEKSNARTAAVVDHQDPLLQPERQGLEVLRRSRDNDLPAVGGELPAVPLRRGAEAEPKALAYPDQRGDGVFPGERGMGAAERAAAPNAERLMDQRNGKIAADEGRVQSGGTGGNVPLQARRETSATTLPAGADGLAHPRGARSTLIEASDLKSHDRYAQSDLRARDKVTQEIISEIEPRRPASTDFSGETPEQMNSWAPGANYVPLVDQHRPAVSKAASVADLPAPKRREHIISEFASAIGTTVYEGRIKGDKKLGYFRPKNEEVRTKHANDLEVAGHEIAHLIDFRAPELKKAWTADKALRDELKSVSYDQKNVREGWAEGMRLWLTQPETLEAKAPRVHAFIESFANSHEYGKPLRKAQEQMTGWFGQDALNRARSKIGTETPLAEYFDRAFDKFRQSTVDDLHGVMQMERDLTGKLSPVGPYESARLSRASTSIADGAVRFGHPVKQADGSFKFAGKGLEEILRPVAKSLDDSLLYFVGRSANELMGQKREHLFTRGEIDAMLRLRTPEREKAFQDYQAWNRGILDFAEAQGIINPETRRLWQRTQYLPFHRVEQPGGIKGKPGDWAGVQALTGGTTNLRDILGNMIGNAAMLLDKAVKNEARLKVADLAESTKAGKWMVKIEPGERPVKIGGDQVLDAMFKRYGIMVDGEAPAFFQFMLKGQPPAGNNVVAVLRDGKPTWYEVGDPILYRSLLAIDRPVQNWLVRMLGAPKRIGQASITLTPDFWMANLARDTLMGSVMSRAGFRPILDSLQGMRLRMTNDPIYQDFIANGGGLSSIFLDEGALRSKLRRFYQRQGIDYRTVLDTPDKLLHAVETLGDAFEMSTRLGEYRRAIQRGEHPRHAAYLGREVSTDFAMRGDSKALGFLYDTVMFLKAATVSWDRLGRGVTIDPNKGAIAAKTAAIAGMSAALYLLNRDDPRYADLPDWDRDSNWHIFVGEHHFRYPKIWEIGSVASMAERSTEKLMAENPEGLGKDFARILGTTFNLNLMPQAVAPLYEQATNRNSFTKSPIETPGMEGVQPFLRAKPGTSETFKALGMATKDNPEWAQVNPARAEALLRGYFNTWGLYGLMLTDQAFFGDQLPEKRADELPVVRRFYASEPARSTKYEREFYDLLNEARRLRGTMKELDDLGMREVADAKEKNPLAGEAKPLERAQKNLAVINRDMEAVRRDDVLSRVEKRLQLNRLTAERNALLKDAVLDSKAAQKQRNVDAP